MNKIIVQEDGLVLAFSALVLPILLLIGAIMIDGGQLFIRHGEIEHLSRQSGQSGLLKIAEILEASAHQNYQNTCEAPLPPSKCSSQNMFDFLSHSEVNQLILNANNQTQVTNNATNFSLDYDPREKLESDEINITYPCLYSVGDKQVKLLVEIQTVPRLLMGTLLKNQQPITYSAVSYLPLQ